MIKAMAMREIQSRYVETFGGLLWSIIRPLMTIAVFWFIFSAGFRVRPAGDVPFLVVFLCGLIPWMMFTEVLMTSTNVISTNVNLVTKTVFPTEILPLVCLVASLITHGIMLVIFAVVLLVSKMSLSFYNFQFLYYLFALSVFSLGLGWFLASVNVFCRDIAQGLGVVLNLWFWLTPIVWNIEMIPQKYRYIIKLNPFYYIVDGYRASFIYRLPIWHNYRLGICFWVVCLSMFAIGAFTFRKLKSEFAEAL